MTGCGLGHRLTWDQWVLYTEHRRPVSVGHGLHHFVFRDVRASICEANRCFQVVELAAVQLKELNQQHAQVLVGDSGINTRMKLKGK